jgi:hypothetical protein
MSAKWPVQRRSKRLLTNFLCMIISPPVVIPYKLSLSLSPYTAWRHGYQTASLTRQNHPINTSINIIIIIIIIIILRSTNLLEMLISYVIPDPQHFT